MKIEVSEIKLVGVHALESGAQVGAQELAVQALPSGWYTDPTTGQYYYYDAQSGQMYVYSAGLLYPLALPTNTVPAPWARLDVTFGSTVRFSLTYKYRGPGGKGFTLYAAVGNNSAGGGEWSGFANSKGIYPPESADWRTITDSIDVVMGQAGYPTHSGEIGAVYFKIESYKSPAYLNALYVVTAAGEFGVLAISKIEKVS